MTAMKRAPFYWLALALPLWLLFALCTYWEPIMRDGWGHHIWHRTYDVSLDMLWAFAKASYEHNNPRLGQVFTLVQHTPGPWHVILTPLLELGVFYMLTALTLGRRPSLRRTDDALVAATIVAMVFIATRSLGPMLFYRPFTGNYLFGFAVNLAWLLPFRLHLADRTGVRPTRIDDAGAGSTRGRWLGIVPMFVLGVAAGLCNEHTDPALAIAGLAALVIYWRRGERFVPWAWAGLAGLVIGALLLFYAPGQDIRYSGLATQQSTLERILDRGAAGNGRILFLILLYLVPLVLWLTPAVIARVRKTVAPQPRTLRAEQLGLVALATLIVLTLLASPKQGDRLYFAASCLACCAAASWVVANIGRVERYLVIALNTLAIAYVGVRLAVTYHGVAAEFEQRIAMIEKGAPNTTVKVAPYTWKRSRYVLGDDFVAVNLRGAVAFAYGLAGIELDQREPTTPPASAVPDEP
jgi:hypothetical protein